MNVISNRVKVWYAKLLKRLIDFIFSITLLIILFFPGLLIAFLIKYTSEGPVFFKQIRVGRNGQKFVIYKFRTMSVEAPHELATSEACDLSEYITSIGSLLRKTSIDELPQLINVLIGNMSIVGPRPLIPSEKQINKERHIMGVDTVLPGITGLAQVKGRDMLNDNQKLKYDLEYCNNLSIGLDFRIICMTIRNVIQHKDIKN